MRKLILLAFLFAACMAGHAQPMIKYRTHKMLAKTAVVLFDAQKELKAAGNYKGDFARAVAHQRFAKRLFFRRNFARAAAHSRYARALAFRVIRDNKGTVQPDWEISADEQEVIETVSDKDLQNELMKTNSHVSTSDEDYMGVLQDVDVNDLPEQ